MTLRLNKQRLHRIQEHQLLVNTISNKIKIIEEKINSIAMAQKHSQESLVNLQAQKTIFEDTLKKLQSKDSTSEAFLNPDEDSEVAKNLFERQKYDKVP